MQLRLTPSNREGKERLRQINNTPIEIFGLTAVSLHPRRVDKKSKGIIIVVAIVVMIHKKD
jgi:hypothetical protein